MAPLFASGTIRPLVALVSDLAGSNPQNEWGFLIFSIVYNSNQNHWNPSESTHLYIIYHSFTLFPIWKTPNLGLIGSWRSWRSGRSAPHRHSMPQLHLRRCHGAQLVPQLQAAQFAAGLGRAMDNFPGRSSGQMSLTGRRSIHFGCHKGGFGVLRAWHYRSRNSYCI